MYQSNTKNKIICIAVAILMVFCFSLPATSFSYAGEEVHDHEGYTAIANLTQLSDLLENGGKGYLSDNLTLTTNLEAKKSFELCLNGHTINTNGHSFGSYLNVGSMTISNCSTSGGVCGNNAEVVGQGGLFYLSGTADLTLKNLVIKDYKAHYGSVLYTNAGFYSGTVTVDNCTISNCVATDQNIGGAVIYIGDSSTADVTFSNCNISNCSAYLGAVVYAYGPSSKDSVVHFNNVNVSNCTAASNNNTPQYGAVYYAANSFTSYKTTLDWNKGSAKDCTGNNLIECFSYNANLTDVEFSNNNAALIDGNELSITGCTVKNNTTSNSNLLCINALDCKNSTLSNNEITNGNVVKILKGGTIEDSKIQNNTMTLTESYSGYDSIAAITYFQNEYKILTLKGNVQINGNKVNGKAANLSIGYSDTMSLDSFTGNVAIDTNNISDMPSSLAGFIVVSANDTNYLSRITLDDPKYLLKYTDDKTIVLADRVSAQPTSDNNYSFKVEKKINDKKSYDVAYTWHTVTSASRSITDADNLPEYSEYVGSYDSTTDTWTANGDYGYFFAINAKAGDIITFDANPGENFLDDCSGTSASRTTDGHYTLVVPADNVCCLCTMSSRVQIKNVKLTHNTIGDAMAGQVSEKLQTNKLTQGLNLVCKASFSATDLDSFVLTSDIVEYIKAKIAPFFVKSKAGKVSIKYTWNKIEGAAKYKIYQAKCGSTKWKCVKTTKDTSFTAKKLKKKAAYKAYVVAYDSDGNQLTKTAVIHCITKKAKMSNATAVKATKSLELKVGETGKLGALISKKDGTKKLLNHGKKIRYYSADKTIATVSNTGVVKAVGAGTTSIYAIALSGACAKTTVTVKKPIANFRFSDGTSYSACTQFKYSIDGGKTYLTATAGLEIFADSITLLATADDMYITFGTGGIQQAMPNEEKIVYQAQEGKTIEIDIQNIK